MVTSLFDGEAFYKSYHLLSHNQAIQTSVTHNNKYQITGIQAGTIVDRTYTHDFEGNISSVKPLDTLPQLWGYEGTSDYTYVQGKDWINNINGTNQYSYDNNGNITADGIRTYVYNQDNRLTQVTKAGVTGQYTYNGNGQRIKKVTGGNTTVYHYDLAGNLIEETGADGTLIVSYIYAGDNRIAMVPANNTIYYYHNDHLGTPLALTNDQGTIAWTAMYNPFGKATVDGSSITNNFRFPGQYYDAESGLHYNWHRYYDPGTGRYVTSDPIGIKKGENHLFTYVKNNPIKQVDPFGLLCGSGLTDLIVPDAPSGFDFSDACYWHDKCYATCRGESSWVDKSYCDDGFYEKMKEICQNRYGSNSACSAWANRYHWGVSNNNIAQRAYLNNRFVNKIYDAVLVLAICQAHDITLFPCI